MSEPKPSGVSINPEGDAVIDGDVVGGNKNVFNITTHHYSAASSEGDKSRRLRLTVHLGTFLRTGVLCYFINAVNLSEREIEITHVWFECDPQIHATQPDRPLPKRLKPDETWETWIEVFRVPDTCGDPHTLGRARLSTGAIVSSEKNENVPGRGFIPGGPIEGRLGETEDN